VLHQVKVEGHEVLGASERAAGVPRLTVKNLTYNVSAYLSANFVEVVKVGLGHAGNFVAKIGQNV
jgi:hypothetical protein